MSDNISKVTNIAKVAIAGIGVVACLFLFFGPNINTDTKDVIDAFRDGTTMNFAVYFFIAIFLLCVALVFFFFGTQLVSNPKKTLMSIIGIVVAFVVFFLIYLIGSADSETTLGLTSKGVSASSSAVNLTTAGIWTVLLSLIAAVGVIIAGMVRKLLNR